MHYLNRETGARYLDACEAWYRPLAEVLIGAGLRIGEAIALEWRDVDWDGIGARHLAPGEGRRQVGTPKGDRARTVLLAPYLLDRPPRAPARPGKRRLDSKARLPQPRGLDARPPQRPPPRPRPAR